ncbi:S28 family serine protease [Micromonospora sonneratiae]|uniref:S28 family serine protease n=1 Tax=Micromonospora sonneratiae TaxID=1184706 RepID=A0ABW3Y971_9ACTN
MTHWRRISNFALVLALAGSVGIAVGSPPAVAEATGTAAATGTAEATGTAAADIRTRIEAIPGVTVLSDRTVALGYRQFILTLRQPNDHRDPSKGTFAQRINLMHLDVDLPTVLYTSGYGVSTGTSRAEPTRLLGGNQISLEHRFFVPSRPTPADWRDLNIWQAATDQHRVVEAFKSIYAGKWISTGASKGGMTAVYHRSFYPRDVDGTVAYVAPNDVVNREDSAYDDFFARVGTDPVCRADLNNLQAEALRRRGELVPRFEAYATTNGLTFTSLFGTADVAFEMLVMDTVWAYWQYLGQGSCASVPKTGATTDAIWTFLDDVAGFNFYTDQGLTPYAPYYYQAATQLGSPSLKFKHLRGLLRYPGAYDAENWVPRDIPIARFEPQAMRHVDNWVRHDGSTLMFVYGERDPWGSERFRLGPGTRDSFVFEAPGANHGANIAGLTVADSAVATAALLRWAEPDSTAESAQGQNSRGVRRLPVRGFRTELDERCVADGDPRACRH